jgi:hypothetical protein
MLPRDLQSWKGHTAQLRMPARKKIGLRPAMAMCNTPKDKRRRKKHFER